MTDKNIMIAIGSGLFVAFVFYWAYIEKVTRKMTPEEKKKFFQGMSDAEDWANGTGKFAPKSDSIHDRPGYL